MSNIHAVVEQINHNPMGTLKTLSAEQLVAILQAADEAFFSSDKTLLSDDIYDIVKAYLKKKDPQNAYLKRVGAVVDFNKEKLPYYLGSLDKLKDNDAKTIEKWKKEYPGNSYIVSEKLDGISCLLYVSDNGIKMYSRGDGNEGQNITHILPYIKSLNGLGSTLNKGLGIRGELIISRDNWRKIQHMGANARNVVAGAIHSKVINKDIVSKIDFVAYDVMHPRKKLSEAFNTLSKELAKIPVVNHINVTADNLTIENLSKILQEWRASSAYEIDGIVVYDNNIVHSIVAGKNPKYAFAFKTILTHEQAEMIVADVEWNVSKHRYLKPTIIFANEVNIGGVKIKQATGFNAAYIEKNKIGPGSHVMLVRSGDVIPHIVSVLSQAPQAKMPTDVKWMWNDTNVDIMLAGDEKNKEQDIQVFTHFMKTIGADGVREGILIKLYDAGYDTLNKIINLSKDDIAKIEGFKDKSATNIYNSLANIKKADCLKLMIASNVFGRGLGEKKLKLIVDKYPDIAKQRLVNVSIDELIAINGIAQISAKQFLEALPKFYDFMDDIGLNSLCSSNNSKPVAKTNEPSKKFENTFKNKAVVFTGFRDKTVEKMIEDAGGRVVSAISGATDILIVKDLSDTTSKVQKAQQFGMKIMSKDELHHLQT
jgi:NAD-dependent DNA ligase